MLGCTCDEVGALRVEVKLLHEEDLAERDEGEDGDVVGQADQTEKPEVDGKREDVSKPDLQQRQPLDQPRLLPAGRC